MALVIQTSQDTLIFVIFFVTDRLKQGHLRVKHLGTSDMIADILTKPLTGALFTKLRDLLLGYTTL